MLETGAMAPDFTLTADDGAEVSLSDFRGKFHRYLRSRGQQRRETEGHGRLFTKFLRSG